MLSFMVYILWRLETMKINDAFYFLPLFNTYICILLFILLVDLGIILYIYIYILPILYQ